MCKVNAKLKSNKIYEKKMETVLPHVQNYGIYKNTESTKRRKKTATVLSCGMSTFAKHIRRLTTIPR